VPFAGLMRCRSHEANIYEKTVEQCARILGLPRLTFARVSFFTTDQLSHEPYLSIAVFLERPSLRDGRSA